MTELEGWGEKGPLPQFLADKLTLFVPGGQIIPTTLLPAPLQIFARCGVSGVNNAMNL